MKCHGGYGSLGPNISTKQQLMRFLQDALGNDNCLLLHGRRGITDGETLVQILPEKGEDAAMTFVLAGVDEFVGDQSAVSVEIAADVDTIPQRETRGVWAHQPGRLTSR